MKVLQLIMSAAALIFLSNICFDNTAQAASTALELVSTSFTGNVNGVFNPGKTFGLAATMTAIYQTASNSSATLTSPDSCVTIKQGSAAYGSISVGQNVSNSSSPFQFSISPSCPTGHLINLTLTMAATGYTSTPIIIPILVSIPTVPYNEPYYTCVTDYYVSSNGSDSNSGASVEQPWATIGHAVTYLEGLGGTHGGVCVNVQPGTRNGYVYASGLSGNSNTPTGYLVFRSMMLHGVTIQVPASDANNTSADSFHFEDANYIIIDGFNLEGQVIPGSIESGVALNLISVPGEHFKITNNIIANHGGAGVLAVHTDYLVAENNTILGNANTSPSEESGINDWQAVASDTATGYHNYIRYNIIFNNAEVNDGLAAHTNGNGIMLNDFRNTQNESTYGAYAQQTLVDDNLIFGNGGAGIHVYSSDHVTVLNNTAYNNYWDTLNPATLRGDINVLNGMNETFANNIAYSNPTTDSHNVSYLDASTNNSNTNNVWANNLSFNGTADQASTLISGSESSISSAQGNILGQNPEFLNPGANEFTLQTGSPAINAGTNTYGYPADDLAGITLYANAISLGAYQYASSTAPLTVATAGNGFGNIFGSTSAFSSLINCGVNSGATICDTALNSDTAVTLSAAAASDSTFSGWTITGSPAGTCTGTTSPCIITVTAATTVTANFTSSTGGYNLTVSTAGSGSGEVTGTGINCGTNETACNENVAKGTVIALTASPAAGSVFSGWSGACSGVGSCSVTVSSAENVTANFNIGHGLTVSTTGSGSGVITGTYVIDCGAGATVCSENVASGTVVTLTATPVSGSIFTGWSGACSGTGSCSVTMSSAESVTANFTPNTFAITASAGTGGTISPSGTVNVNYGANQTFTVTPHAGYTAQLMVDGSTVTLTNNTYTLKDVTTTHTVVASFSLQAASNTVSVTFLPSGTASSSGASGQTVSVQILGNFAQVSGDLQFTLTYDSNLLTATSVQPGSATTGWTESANTNTAGTVKVAMFNTSATLTGSGQQVAIINFTVKTPPANYGTSSTTLALSSILFADSSVTSVANATFTDTTT